MSEINRPGHKQHTLCWDCAKATTGECNWSQAEDYSPVPGWKAIPTVIHSTLESGRTDSFIVIECPEFRRDARRFGQRRMTMRIWEAAEVLKEMKRRVHTDDLETTIRVAKENEAIDTALCYIFDTTDLYEAWARENNKHVCATCKNNSENVANGTRCPIQEHYTLPKDGYCHLWEGMKQDDQPEQG